jgi:hypothetical protein
LCNAAFAVLVAAAAGSSLILFAGRVWPSSPLRGIDGLEVANAFVVALTVDYNRRFARAPSAPEDAHRALAPSARELDPLLSEHHERAP